MRKLIVLLVVLAVAAVVADRAGARIAERAIGDRLQTSAELTARPTVTIEGIPFLSQAMSGHYGRIEVTATDLTRGGVHLTSLHVQVTGAQVSLSDVLHGAVNGIPVSGLTATGLVTYADLEHSSQLVGMHITPMDGEVRVIARLTVLGRSVTASAVSRVALRGRGIAITAQSLKVLGQTSPGILNALTGRLDLLVPIGTLPYGLKLTGLTVTPQGVELQARSGPTVLSTS